MQKLKRKLGIALFAYCLLLPSAGWAADTTTTAPQTVTMQALQYSRLKEIINQQSMLLETLQLKLTMLRQTSTQDKQTLLQLQDELTSCKTEQTQTQQSLTSAKASLMSAELTLKKQEESLQTLKEKITSMTNEQKRLKRQRNTWAVVAGVAMFWIACK